MAKQKSISLYEILRSDGIVDSIIEKSTKKNTFTVSKKDLATFRKVAKACTDEADFAKFLREGLDGAPPVKLDKHEMASLRGGGFIAECTKRFVNWFQGEYDAPDERPINIVAASDATRVAR